MLTERDERDGIYVMATAGGAPRRVAGTEGLDLYPTWSPDGEGIAFTRPSLRVVEGRRTSSLHLHAVPSRWGRPTRLTNEHSADAPMSWQPLPRRAAATP
jgi:Tol biopolymer transport system component